MTIIQINSELERKLFTVAEHIENPIQLSQSIANSFLTVVEDNFDNEGRPTWAGLSPVTLARRKPGKKLFQEGRLRQSIVSDSTADSVIIGSSDLKAPTHQFGAKQGEYGKTKRNTPIPWGDIQSRPFLPFDTNGFLQQEAEDVMVDDVDYFFKKIFD